ncbi:MAG TPA: acyltransferase [Candidatus Methylomirabilis sp.]|nr:acyltransferase [Candidatus Methylomirabilis sp.]
MTALTEIEEAVGVCLAPDHAGARTAGPYRLGYRPALDGLRGIAVLAVMLHHTGVLEGGWLGVDVFFTLSGFLITSLLLEEYARTGAIALGRFYARRALRLVPALLALVAVFGVIIIASDPRIALPVAVRLATVVLYVTNWAMMYQVTLYPFLHTWSLAIEEQFYLLWPVLLLLLLRRISRRGVLLLVAAAGVAASAVWRGVLIQEHASLARVWVGLDVRADSLLVGCGLAMLTTWRMLPAVAGAAPRLLTLAAGLGLCSLFATATFPADMERFAGTLTGIASALVIGDILTPRSWLAPLLCRWPLVAVGRISYGLYLWHYPIFVLFGVLVTQITTVDPLRASLAWATTFAVCVASFRFVERPALRLKARFAAGGGGSALDAVNAPFLREGSR